MARLTRIAASLPWRRREFLRTAGLSIAVAPFALRLPSLGWAGDASPSPPQRLVLMFTPNGTVPPAFWPEQTGDQFTLREILEPLAPYQEQLLILKGISNKVRGDGDSHMRGMSCLLTGIELFPGNIQGGSHTPAGWASGISIDQQIARFLQANPATQTRFASLEFGVSVPHRADPWTRWVYGGPNRPIAPIDDPYQMFDKLYGRRQDDRTLRSVLDRLRDDLASLRPRLSADDRRLLEAHESSLRDLERQLQIEATTQVEQVPDLPEGVANENDNMPQLAAMQLQLLHQALQADMTRVATLQFTRSVGQARMRWLGIEEGHHALSHDPDLDEPSQRKLIQINRWFCEQLRQFVDRLAQTPEPGYAGSMLDHTTIIWTNELGKGNSHSLDNIPFVAIGRALGWKMGRSLQFDRVAHNRLLLSIAHACGHEIDTFGNPQLCEGGPLDLHS